MCKRAKVQGSRKLKIPDGTISWEEHLKIWEVYHSKWHSYQSAERINERGGFGIDEIIELLGMQPVTWKAL